MKKIYYSLLMLAVVGVGLTSCDEDRDNNPTFHQGSDTFVLNTPAFAVNNVYDLQTAENIVLTTSQPDYGGFPLSTVYTVYAGISEDKMEALSTTSTSTLVKVPASELNELILAQAGDADLSAPIPVYFYLTAHVNGQDTLGFAKSNTITLPNVLAYVPVVEISLPEKVHIVGSFPASDGWANFVPLAPAFSQEGFYYGVAYMPAGAEFKINPDAGWKGNDKGYGQLTINDNANAGISSADESNVAANIKVANEGWYNFVVNAKISNGAVQYTVNVNPAKVYVIGAAAGGEWSLQDAWAFTAPADAGEWVSPAFTGSGELRLFIDCGIDWWKTEFTIKTDGSLFYRNVDIPANWAENVGADYSCQVNPGQKAYINFTAGTGRVE
ncbi:MAG: SusF/SusE family outer membrane protein [Bacteroidaceae bacterium]|nr:SusF/SusE family outer membrane protein [Bacteroidaceae bacterium]